MFNFSKFLEFNVICHIPLLYSIIALFKPAFLLISKQQVKNIQWLEAPSQSMCLLWIQQF